MIRRNCPPPPCVPLLADRSRATRLQSDPVVRGRQRDQATLNWTNLERFGPMSAVSCSSFVAPRGAEPRIDRWQDQERQDGGCNDPTDDYGGEGR